MLAADIGFGLSSQHAAFAERQLLIGYQTPRRGTAGGGARSELRATARWRVDHGGLRPVREQDMRALDPFVRDLKGLLRECGCRCVPVR